ncbi:MAG: hypothetical protein ACLU2J_06325 [Clostridia bacterium]
MGKASFFTIKDRSGFIQIYISINDVREAYSCLKLLILEYCRC